MIPYSRQNITWSDIGSVIKVMRSDYLTTGPKVKEFEKALCNYTGAEYCTVVNSGSSALYIAAKILFNSMQKQKILTTPISFVATSSCIVHSGNIPFFGDISIEDYNLDLLSISEGIRDEVNGIVYTDLAGYPHEEFGMNEYRNFDYSVPVIKDACHSLGAHNFYGSKIGCCDNVDATVFSFHPLKAITTAEGGAIMTNDKSLDKEAKKNEK